MRDALNLTFEQLASIGAAIGALMVGLYTAWRGYRSKPVIPAIPPIMSQEMADQLDKIENIARHTEAKVDRLLTDVGNVHTDTQVLRDRKG
jgi:hypothetical protein